jgi:predicted Zn-dependent protease
MDVNEGTSGSGSPLSSFPQYQPPRKRNKFWSFMRIVRRYWYIIAGVVIVLAVIIFFQVKQANAEAAWKRAQDSFAKADYDNAAKAMQGLGIPSDPDRLRVYSQTMLATRQLDQALAGYERLYSAKKDPAVKIIMGNIYNEKKQHDKAIELYREYG